MWAALRDVADYEGVSVSDIIRRAIDDYMLRR
jgi:hypothetical protein